MGNTGRLLELGMAVHPNDGGSVLPHGAHRLGQHGDGHADLTGSCQRHAGANGRCHSQSIGE